MSEWKIRVTKKVSLSQPVLIEGMPGIGNVGKIAADLIVEQLRATRIISFFSYCLPNSVFVKEDNLVELPRIELYHKKKNKKDFLFLVGDVQPMKEEDSYSFTQAVLNTVAKYKCKEIITLGGIGLQEHPRKPKVYCTGNDKRLIQEFVGLGASNKVYGIVGPIMGVSGLLLGMSKAKGIRAASLLAETYGHPMHIGLRGAKEIMRILEKKYSLGIDLKKLERDIKSFETELKPLTKQQELTAHETLKDMTYKDTSYIG